MVYLRKDRTTSTDLDNSEHSVMFGGPDEVMV